MLLSPTLVSTILSQEFSKRCLHIAIFTFPKVLISSPCTLVNYR